MKTEAQNKRLTEPGTPVAISTAFWQFAIEECGHDPLTAQHALTTVREWVANAKQRMAELEAALKETQQAKSIGRRTRSCACLPAWRS